MDSTAASVLTKETWSFMDEFPARVRERVALLDGVLHISDDLRGDADLMALVGNLRRRGIMRWDFHRPSDFEADYSYATRRVALGETDIEQKAVDLIARAYATGASDIHIIDNGSYTQIKFRILGRMCEDTQLPADTGRRMLRCIYDHLGKSTDSPSFSAHERLDGRIVDTDRLPKGVHSIRIHSEPIEAAQADSGVGTFMALRLLYDATSARGSLEDRLTTLGFSAQHMDSFRGLTQRTGLVIISGPTGHGKSTVLRHVMESMTEEYPEKAFHSAEDPPEVPMRNVNQIKVITRQDADLQQRAQAYINAIAGAMRSDPDVFMIGELRYPEAAVAAMDAALTGHAVWTTIHANNAFGIISRLETLLRLAHFRDPLSSLCDPNVLAGLEYQRLLPVLCPHCKIPYRDLKGDARREAIPPLVLKGLNGALEHEDIFGGVGLDGVERQGVFVQGEGCEHCRKQGFVGQTVASEVVQLDQDMLALLRQGRMAESFKVWREKGGYADKDNKKHVNRTYIEHAQDLVREGLVDPVATTSRLGVPLNFSTFFEGGR